MAIIDRIYRTCQNVVNKEQRGYFTPEEVNNILNLAQNRIFETYFHDYNYFENAMKAGRTNSEFANLPKHYRERINLLSATNTVTATSPTVTLPTDLYRLVEVNIGGTLVEEEEHDKNRYAQASPLARSTDSRPTFLRFGNNIEISRTTAPTADASVDVSLTYIKRPAVPKWTYTTVSGQAFFNESASDFQDVEIHPADEHELVVEVLKYLGILLESPDISNFAVGMDQTDTQNEFRV